MIIVVDFNVRIGDKQALIDNKTVFNRKSEGTNKYGRKKTARIL